MFQAEGSMCGDLKLKDSFGVTERARGSSVWLGSECGELEQVRDTLHSWLRVLRSRSPVPFGKPSTSQWGGCPFDVLCPVWPSSPHL